MNNVNFVFHIQLIRPTYSEASTKNNIELRKLKINKPLILDPQAGLE